MLERLFDFIDKIINVTGDWFDKGFFYYAIVIGVVILVVTAPIVIYLLLKSHNQEQTTPEQELVSENAESYCNDRGYDMWKWTGEGNFTCYYFNETENKTIDDFYVP